MDLNYLYKRHQISLVMAQRARCEHSRGAHQALADAYQSMIAAARTRPLNRAA